MGLFLSYKRKLHLYKEKTYACFLPLWQELRRRVTDYARTHRLYRRKRFNGRYSYTVVSAVFNVEKYLDDYFTTLTNQILDFKTHIHLILVDDGSTDGSVKVIKRWQQRYPKNITYLYKENGGQGSARNAGLPLVKTPWVTFIDPDDFIDVSYFWHVDTLLCKHHREDMPDKAVKLLSCNFYIYREATGRFANKHPLRKRFKRRETLKRIGELGNIIQMNVTSVFFPTTELHASGLLFSEHRWPNFEDAHFVLRYLMMQTEGTLLYARYPRYYYRKRADGSSSLDTAVCKREYYTKTLREATLPLLRQAGSERESIPDFLQYAVLYHISWLIRRAYGAPLPACLSADDAEECFRLCREIFAHIEERMIRLFPTALSGLEQWHKAGILAAFKGHVLPDFPVVIERLDHGQGLILLSYEYGSMTDVPEEKFYVDGRESTPLEAKSASKCFLGRKFSVRRLVWLPVPSIKEKLSVSLDRKSALLSLGGKVAGEYSGADIGNHFSPTPLPAKSLPYADAWLLLDRDVEADDNAEHLYRYLRTRAPERHIFFALRSSSPHWRRLKAEGFNLLDFGSRQYEHVLRGCAKLISSHVDNYVTNYFPNILKHKHFIGLRHGVNLHDLSRWLNQKKIDLYSAATPQEYSAMVEDYSLYHFTRKEVKLTGLARHDALLARDRGSEKLVLVMPTWRASLMGKSKNLRRTSARGINENFMCSRYARCWQSLLASPRLKQMMEKAEYSIMFFPHPNIQPYLEQFHLGSHVALYRNDEGRIQEIFCRTRILLTDYSSVAFDLALLQRAILYYQFDRDEIFSGAHTIQKGYYDHDRDGFGPTAFDEENVLNELEKLLRRDGSPDPVYRRRMENAFPFRDGKNCERIYQAICALDQPIGNRLANSPSSDKPPLPARRTA